MCTPRIRVRCRSKMWHAKSHGLPMRPGGHTSPRHHIQDTHEMHVYDKIRKIEVFKRDQKSRLIRLALPQCFCPRGRKLRPWSEKNSDQNSDHPRLCIYWGKEKLRPWSEFLGRENSDHGLSFGCFWGRGRRGGSQKVFKRGCFLQDSGPKGIDRRGSK